MPPRILDGSEENTGPVGNNSVKKEREDDERAGNDIEEGQERETLFEGKV